MTNLVIGALAALMSTNQPQAVSNFVQENTGISVAAPNPDDPVEKELHKLMEDDQAALDEVDGWIRENNEFKAKGAGMPNGDLNARIRARFEPVKKGYEDFLKRHSDSSRGHLAYGSFLEDSQDEDGAIAEYEKALAADPKNPAPYNQLANHYTHDGPILKAFEYYEKAIALDPTEPVYYRNLATTVYLFRKDSTAYYHIDEQAVFTKALGLYEQAMKLDPKNFELAQDLAESYYGIRPTRTEDALIAWTNALNIATNEEEREGVYVHLARFKLNADRFGEARQDLTRVTNQVFDVLKARILKNIETREATNKTAAVVDTNKPVAK